MIDTMGEPNCVGALIRDRDNRVYLQRRSLQRRQLPGAWDIVGGHVEPGETAEAALAREVREETGWRLRRIEAVVADWEWTHDGVVQRELDYLIEVNGDLDSPRLEAGKHDKFCWVSYDNPEHVRSEYDAGNDMLWNIVKRATRIRLTSSLRLEPVSASSVNALRQLFQGGAVTLDGNSISEAEIPASAARFDRLWNTGDGYNWMVYWRNAPQSPIGYCGLTRRQARGADEFVLHCAVSSDERVLGTAAEIVKAALAFTHNELNASNVFAPVSPANRWAAEVVSRSGMRPVDPFEPGRRRGETFGISFRDDSSYDLDQKVVTGIGQIMAVPA